MQTTRRGFVGGAAGAAFATGGPAAAAPENGDLKLGVASYSLRKLPRAQAIAAIKELRSSYVSIKEMHLPYKSTADELKQGRAEFEAAGLKILSGGNNSIQVDTDEDVRRLAARLLRHISPGDGS